MSNSLVTSGSAASSTVSSSDGHLVKPPVEQEEKKKQVDDAHVKNQLVNEWMSGIGNLYGATEIRENVKKLHGHLLPAIEALKKMLEHSSEGMAGEVNKLLVYYSSLAKICDKMTEKIEKSNSAEEFQKTEQSASCSEPVPVVEFVNEKKQ